MGGLLIYVNSLIKVPKCPIYRLKSVIELPILKILSDLKYDEPKHYLKKVTKRMGAYYRLYGS